MASPSNSIVGLENRCANALRSFVKAVKESKSHGRLPIILTISRRMPHVLYWFKCTHASEEERKTLDETEIISEIALPFIDFKEKDEFEIFIIDDVVSSGRTLSYVRTLTEIITKTETSKVFVLFCDVYSPYFVFYGDDTVIGYTYSSKEEKTQISDFISTVIALTLPIDVTYPILYFSEEIEESQFKDFQKIFRDPSSSEAENYPIRVSYRMDLALGDIDVKKGDCCESFTALLPSEISNSLNKDFAKIRTYKRFHSYLVVPYAPNVLTDGGLTKKDLFESSEYSNVWSACLRSVNKDFLKPYSPFDNDAYEKEAAANRSYRSLVSVANYLYSLSSFNKLATQHLPKLVSEIGEKATDFSIHVSDLSLIVGRTLAEKILPALKTILEGRIVSQRTHKKVSIPSTFIPASYEQDYTVSKYMSLPVEESDMSKKLQRIFRNASEKKASYPAFRLEDIEFGVEGIMESFESLGKTLQAKSHEERIEINRWVDERIDHGEIVSRYARVMDTNGLPYWRRFFRLSSSLVN